MNYAPILYPFYILCTHCPFIDFLFREPPSELSYFTPIDIPKYDNTDSKVLVICFELYDDCYKIIEILPFLFS